MIHVHVLVYGEYVPQPALQDAWTKALGEERAIVHVTAVSAARGVASALREVLKYATKGETGRDSARHAAAVELAFRDVHRVAIGGALRKIKVEDSDGATDDVRPEDLHDDHTLACEACGVVGQWRWVGVLRSDLVNALGGFGFVQADIPSLTCEMG